MWTSVAYLSRRLLTSSIYVHHSPGWPVPTEFGNTTRDLTAASVGPEKYFLNNNDAAHSSILYASQADLKSCEKAIAGVGSFSENVWSFIWRAVSFAI